MSVTAPNRAGNQPFTDKYDVEGVLGRGGMGTVFEARHSRLGHRVAIKVLGEELRVHPELVKRFEREARAAGALSSPRAVKIFDIDQTADGTPFMVMELLKGRDLAHVVEHGGPQPIGAAVRWIVEASDAIAEAHRLGIIHRDIKPSNLFLCSDTGSVKVLDFGIAKRVEAKEAAITLGVAPLGTPQYMSPEQVRCAKDIDARTDIWSLGVTLYELVCGRPPFNHEVAQACIVAIVADPVPDPREFRPDLPEELAEAILRALAKDPEERFRSIDELVLALEPFAEKSEAREDTSWRSLPTTRRTVANELTTLDGEDLVLELQSERGNLIEEQTVPPAVSPTSARMTRGKRIRSSIALGSAALLGLGALVATPRCVGARLDAASTANVATAPPVAEAVAKAAALPVVTATATEIAPPKLEESASSKTAPTPAIAEASAPRPFTKPVKFVRPLSSAPVRVIGSERPVHGGISSPGF